MARKQSKKRKKTPEAPRVAKKAIPVSLSRWQKFLKWLRK